jgi:type I restriction enzyme S subunit
LIVSASSLAARVRTRPWFQGLPATWDLRRLKEVASFRFSNVDKHSVEGEIPVQLCNYVNVYHNESITEKLEFMAATAGRHQIERFELRRGDVLATKDSESWQDIAVPAHVPADLPGVVCGYHLALARPQPGVLDGRFLFRCLSARGINDQFRVEATGITRFGVGLDGFGSALLPIPPISQQCAIADFLDRKASEIDALVAKKERLIELLQEKRSALITRAVSKGLDPAVPMKDSGIAWLGSIPAHWQLKPLMRLTPDSRPIMYGIVLPGPNVDDGVPIVKGGDVGPGRLRLELLCRTTREIEAGYVRSRLRAGDLVYAIRGSIGDVEIVPEELEGANLTQDAARVAPRPGVWGPWLLAALRSRVTFAQLESRATGATISGINIRDLKRVLLPVPSLEEQKRIAEALNAQLRRLSDIGAKVSDAIDRLREYRTALISAAVTGKIDVRVSTTHPGAADAV